jgi:hypothetical protein
MGFLIVLLHVTWSRHEFPGQWCNEEANTSMDRSGGRLKRLRRRNQHVDMACEVFVGAVRHSHCIDFRSEVVRSSHDPQAEVQTVSTPLAKD